MADAEDEVGGFCVEAKVREKKSSGRIVKPVPGWLAAGPQCLVQKGR